MVLTGVVQARATAQALVQGFELWAVGATMGGTVRATGMAKQCTLQGLQARKQGPPPNTEARPLGAHVSRQEQ
eukprot:11443686-Alexandrium_andersonii.AAC.1